MPGVVNPVTPARSSWCLAGYEADLKALAARVRQSAMCQVMMLSATLSPEVRCLSQAMLHNPHEVDVAEEEAGADDASAASGE